MRKKPQYLCTECRLEFDEPVYKTVEELIDTFYLDENTADVRDKCFISKNEWRNEHNLSQVKYWLQREKAKTKSCNEIEKEAFLLYIR